MSAGQPAIAARVLALVLASAALARPDLRARRDGDPVRVVSVRVDDGPRRLRKSPAVVAGGAPTSAGPNDAAAGPSTERWPSIAMVVGDPLGAESAVLAVAPDGERTEIGRVSHAPGAALRASTLPSGDVAVVADVASEKDLSFAGSLFVSRAGRATRRLADGVVHSSSALAWDEGRVLVSRGVAGAADATSPPPGTKGFGTSRVDDLTVDAVDVDTGDAETIASYRGYLLFIAGRTPNGALLYRVGPDGADVIEVDASTLETRVVVASLPAQARDFSIDPNGNEAVFVDRDADGWAVLRLDLVTGKIATIERGASMQLVPHALGSSDVLLTRDGARGPERISGAPIRLGSGMAHVADVTRDGAIATGVVSDPGKLGRPFLVDLASGDARFVDVDAGERAVVAGFLPEVSR